MALIAVAGVAALFPAGPSHAQDIARAIVQACDQLAASPYDTPLPLGIVGIPWDTMDAPRAVAACKKAVDLVPPADPAAPRVWFEYARALDKADDQKTALFWYRKSAQAGYGMASYTLSFIYQKGDFGGVAVDVREAFRLAQAAADRNIPAAQFRLAILYQDGIGTAVDVARAISLYQLAIDGGFTEASRYLALIYENNTDYRNLEKAIYYWRQAAAAGDADAGKHLAALGAQNGVVPPNSAVGKEPGSAAVAANNPQAGKPTLPADFKSPLSPAAAYAVRLTTETAGFQRDLIYCANGATADDIDKGKSFWQDIKGVTPGEFCRGLIEASADAEFTAKTTGKPIASPQLELLAPYREIAARAGLPYNDASAQKIVDALVANSKAPGTKDVKGAFVNIKVDGKDVALYPGLALDAAATKTLKQSLATGVIPPRVFPYADAQMTKIVDYCSRNIVPTNEQCSATGEDIAAIYLANPNKKKK